jgi:hypothetical protein
MPKLTTLTGKTRVRLHARLIAHPLLVLQVEERITTCTDRNIINVCKDITRWRDARPDDKIVEHAEIVSELQTIVEKLA